MEKQFRHNRLIMVCVLLIFLVLSWTLVNILVGQVGRSADEEVLTHIRENTEQLYYSFSNRIEDTWTIMRIEAQSLGRLADASEQEVLEVIALLQEQSVANDVYLINKEGRYLDGSGRAGQWQLDASMLPLLRGEETLCRLRQRDTGADCLDFAVLLDTPLTEHGYCILLLEYTPDTFLKVLELKTYGGQGVAYVVDSAGWTLFRSEGTLPTDHVQNYFFYQFLEGMAFEGNEEITDADALRAAVNAGESDAVYVSGEEYAYALSFRPLSIMDWHLILMVERSVISGGRMEYMRQVQWIALCANLFILAVCLGFYWLNSLWINRRAAVQLSSRERIIHVLSVNSQGVYLLMESATGRCTFASESLQSMLGVEPQSLTGRPVSILLEMFGNPALQKMLQAWDRKGMLDSERFLFHAEPDDEGRYLRVRVFPPLKGEVVMAVLDETADARREKALEDAVNLARSANQAKSMFLSNMSHDIRTPLNAVIGFTTLAIANQDKPDKVKDYLSKILASGNHLLSLINDVLDMSRIESGRIHLDEQEANLSDIFHDLKTIISGQIHARQLELYMDIMDVTDEDVFCDKTRLNQVLLNLLSNAIKFTAPGGTITVRVAQLPGAPEGKGLYEIRVKDTGIGMSPEFARRIFEPFERERTSTVSRIQGTGLGMAISKNIIDMMGGEIAVTTEQDKGTEFVVRLTLKLQSERRRVEVIRELAGLKGLVVDDDFNTCDSVTRMLLQVGMRSEWTLSGKEAVLRARQSLEIGDPFQAYIIDWRLPDMNGIEVTRQIRRLGDETPIIILTAYDWEEIEVEARAAGVTAFCEKPMFMSDLRDTLLRALGRETEKTDALPGADGDEDLAGKRILLVEDNDLNREIGCEILTEYGFAVDEAENGEEAVRKVSRSAPGQYDLVLMDIQMPIMDGCEAARRIRALENPALASLPIIAMTANAFEDDRRAAIESGMNGFLSKPIDIADVIETIRAVFRQKH